MCRKISYVHDKKNQKHAKLQVQIFDKKSKKYFNEKKC